MIASYAGVPAWAFWIGQLAEIVLLSGFGGN